MGQYEWSEEKRAAKRAYDMRVRAKRGVSAPPVPVAKVAPSKAGQLRRYRYGLTEEAYLGLLLAQDNACAICRTPFEGFKVCVDHCHETGEVRGLLCDNCNVGLGRFKDDVQRVAAALAYLTKRPQRG
jgi:hypothetical protein